MKNTLLFACVLLLNSCDNDVEVNLIPVASTLKNISNSCEELHAGQLINDAYEIMDGATTVKVENTKGTNSGEGYIVFWNSPKNMELITKEPLRIAIPHNDICRIEYDKAKRLTKVTYSYISEEEYQRKVELTK